MIGRPRNRRGRSGARPLVVALIAFAAVLASTTGVADAGLQSKVDAAKNEAQALEAKIQARGDRIAELETQAGEAESRIKSLTAELTAGEQRSAELSAQLGVAEQDLADAQAHLRRARKVLAARLVDIYKNGEADYLGLVLSSKGFDDLTSRAGYLRAIENADSRVTDRVDALAAEVEAELKRIEDLKAEIDDHNAQLVSDRQAVADTRASLKAQAAELASAKAQEADDLAAIRATIEDLKAQIGAKQLGALFGNGQWAIPEYIVMCESGGNYHALNASSGAGGAYQILPSTWRLYGGTGLPHQAPPAEQDKIAAMIWADSGPSAWVCA